MTHIKIISYVYTKKLLNFIIAYWTWLRNPFTRPASHTEIGFNLTRDDLNYMRKTYPEKIADLPTHAGWWYFSSTMRDGANGCRWIYRDDVIKYKERWIMQEHKSWERPKWLMLDECCKMLGCRYDKLGIAGFITPVPLNEKNAWYCSEAVWKIFMGFWKKRISPRTLIAKAEKLGFNYVEMA